MCFSSPLELVCSLLVSFSLLPAFPVTTWHPRTSLLLRNTASLKFAGCPFALSPHRDFYLTTSLSGNMLKVLVCFILFGWGIGGRAGGVHVVSERKLEVALSDLLKASLGPADARGLLKAVIWKGAALSRFALPAAFHATEALGLFCCRFLFCPSTIFVVVSPSTCCTKIQVTA